VTAGASATAAAPPAKQGKQAKEAKPKKEKAAGAPSGPLELNPPPGYFEERIKIFDEYKAKYDAEIAGELLETLVLGHGS
jgi:threonyl-tRNA synthetase